MYPTVQAIHNAIDIGLQRIHSNRQGSFAPATVDIIFNSNMLKFINTRTSSKLNAKQEGLDDSSKRVSDLQELKINTGYKTISIDTEEDDMVYVNLPSNFKQFYSGKVKLYYDCTVSTMKTKSTTLNTATLNFPDDTVGSTSEYYKDIQLSLVDNNGNTIVLFSVNGYYNYPIRRSSAAKFMLIKTILNSVNLPVEIYWENYGNTFIPNSFIIVDFTNTYASATITYTTSGTVSLTAQFTQVSSSVYDTINNFNSDVELVGSDKFNALRANYYYNKNRHKKPICKIEHGRCYILHTNFYPVSFKLEYISIPKFIDSFTGQMTNLKTNIEDVIGMTIEDMTGILNGTYEAQINRNIKNE